MTTDFNRTAVRVDTATVSSRVIAALEASQPQTRGELMKNCDLMDIEANVALDRMQTADEVVRKVIAGRIVYHLPDWEPPKLQRGAAPRAPDGLQPAVAKLLAAPAPKAVATSAEVPSGAQVTLPQVAATPVALPPSPSTAAHVRLPTPGCNQRRVLDALYRFGKPTRMEDIASFLQLSNDSTSSALKEMKKSIFGLGDNLGSTRAAVWFLTEKSRAALDAIPGNTLTPIPASALQHTESSPGSSIAPAAQPIDAAVSTADPAGSTTSNPVTDPPGPRDSSGPSIPDDADIPGTPAWHAARAEAEAERRSRPRSQSTFGDINDLLTAASVLHDVAEAATQPFIEPDVATSIQISKDAAFALWSDGRLEIAAGDDFVSLTPGVTRALIRYLDHTCGVIPEATAN